MHKEKGIILKFFKFNIIVTLLVFTGLSPGYCRHRGWSNYWYDPYPYYGYHRPYHDDSGAAVVAGIFGTALTAAAVASSYEDDPVDKAKRRWEGKRARQAQSLINQYESTEKSKSKYIRDINKKIKKLERKQELVLKKIKKALSREESDLNPLDLVALNESQLEKYSSRLQSLVFEYSNLDSQNEAHLRSLKKKVEAYDKKLKKLKKQVDSKLEDSSELESEV